jgi:hypothetical protein
MVQGCSTLAETYDLYFITITCRGREITSGYADENYGTWTNKLLDACRAQAVRNQRPWHYVQVTERQKRGHPHSHFITTFNPKDGKPERVTKWGHDEKGKRKKRTYTAIRSQWFGKQVIRSGLGEQYEITRVENAGAASRYVAKYLFKPEIFDNAWPKGWKRIRYSQSFPKPDEREATAFVLLTQEDWYKLATLAVVVTVTNLDDYQEASNRLHFHDTLIRLKTVS